MKFLEVELSSFSRNLARMRRRGETVCERFGQPPLTLTLNSRANGRSEYPSLKAAEPPG
jgi:hypothetical protein